MLCDTAGNYGVCHAGRYDYFLCPQSGPMGGFARTSPSYETPYTVDDTMGKMVGEKDIHSLACLKIQIKVGF